MQAYRKLFIINFLGEKMQYLIEPYPHQKEILELSRKQKNLALLWEMGTGKTGAVINIIRDKFAGNKRIMKTLILSPQVTLFNWKEEFAKFSKIPEGKVHVLNGSGKKRVQLAEKYTKSGDCIIITNWEALLNNDVYNLIYGWLPEIIVGDELHLIKSYKSKRSRAAVILADACREAGGHIYGLTGTAILNSIEDVYMQYRFLDGGKAFGKNFFSFRADYMRDANASWSSKPGHFPKFEPRPEKYPELNKLIYSKATRVTKEDAMPFLPPLVKTIRQVDMGPQQKKMYKQMKEEFITFIKTEETKGKTKAAIATIAVTKALRLLQITSGYVTDEDGQEIEIPNNPRLKEVKALLEELTPNNKVILWCSFKNNYKTLSRVCDELGINHVFITGEQTAREKQEAMKAFENDPDCRVVIANRRAGGIGINLVAASYSIVYSRNFSLGEEKQSEARNHRGGSQQHEKIVKIDLVAKNTIDEMVLKALKCKQQVSDLVIDWAKQEAK